MTRLVCDCCDRGAGDLELAVYPTEDDDAVMLCRDCASMLAEMAGREEF